jgi:hypothetical protein
MFALTLVCVFVLAASASHAPFDHLAEWIRTHGGQVSASLELAVVGPENRNLRAREEIQVRIGRKKV